GKVTPDNRSFVAFDTVRPAHPHDHQDFESALTEEQEERLGETLMILHDRMIELCARYDLSMQDLNLNLGPLGTLLPPTE
ncbi:gas vesicle protein K, partial [Streptomyces sp. NPDC005091]